MLIRGDFLNGLEICDTMLRAVILGLVVLLSIGGLACAQSAGPLSRPMFGSTNETYKRHYGPAGKACLTLSGSSRAQIINKDMYDHWISAANDCAQRIKVQVCYYHTQDCIMVDVPPYGRQDVVLGVYPKLREFRYEYKEQF